MGETRCMIIGAGNIVLQLLRMLSRDLMITLIDTDDTSLQRGQEVLPDNLEIHCGDAASRLLLERVGVANVDSVVITTTTEIVNIEIARVLHDHFKVPRVLVIGITQDGIRQLAGFDCEVEGIFKVSATGLRNCLEQRTKTVHGIRSWQERNPESGSPPPFPSGQQTAWVPQAAIMARWNPLS
jgi:Trk K+ transport system NAD-binding subunit